MATKPKTLLVKMILQLQHQRKHHLCKGILAAANKPTPPLGLKGMMLKWIRYRKNKKENKPTTI